jgi:hypothetical protein
MVCVPETAVQFCQVGALPWQVQVPAPMEPVPEARRSLSPVRFLNGGSRFLRHHPNKNRGTYVLQVHPSLDQCITHTQKRHARWVHAHHLKAFFLPSLPILHSTLKRGPSYARRFEQRAAR